MTNLELAQAHLTFDPHLPHHMIAHNTDLMNHPPRNHLIHLPYNSYQTLAHLQEYDIQEHQVCRIQIQWLHLILKIGLWCEEVCTGLLL